MRLRRFRGVRKNARERNKETNKNVIDPKIVVKAVIPVPNASG